MAVAAKTPTGAKQNAPRDPRKKTATQSNANAGLQRIFLLVAGLFVAVVIGTGYFQVNAVNGEIRQSVAESTGSTFISPVSQFASAMFGHRKLAEEARVRGAPQSAVNEVQNGLKTTLGKLQQMSAQSANVVDLTDVTKTLSERAGAVYKTTSTGSIPSSDAYDAVNASIVKFLSELRDRSRLTVDNELETSYMIAVQMDDLPNTVSLVLSGATADRLDQAAAKLARDMGHVFELDDELKSVFSSDFDKVLASLSALISTEQAEGTGSDAAMEARVTARDVTLAYAGKSAGTLTQLLNKRTERLKKQRLTVIVVGFLILAAALAALGLAARTAIKASEEREAQAERIRVQDQANQQAVLQLLNEMADVAGGDLRVHAKVTESVTGALADSINFTIDELRKLVTQVNVAAEQVTQSVDQTRGVSEDLYATSQQQRDVVDRSGGQMMQLTELIGEAAKTAEESAMVAQRSLAAAEKGSLAVGDSIMSMNDIRERIQETAKQIKRLGESSQEIGEIVELISDITEQTNVLALNASIQAVSAGEAGRGFAIVAEEIQRLAERSAEATKQIGNLVRRIQNDTQESIATMEKSTQGVVEGTKLSDIAGVSLNEIRDVSGDLADLIRKIADVAKKQNAISELMAQDIPQVLGATEKVAQGTQQANESIAHVAKLAGDLKKSVSGFKV